MTRAEERAYHRQNILMDLTRRGLTLCQYTEAYNTGHIGRQGGIEKLSPATLSRWQTRHREGGIENLAPRYNTPVGGGARTLSAQDKELLQAYWLDDRRPSIAHALRNIKRYHGADIDYSAARRYLAALPRAAVIRRREGAKAYNDKAAPSISRNYEAYDVMQAVSADHHVLDLLCRHPQKGTPFRPWITMITDFRSRKPLGWQIAITPNRFSILSALEKCVDGYGIPGEIHIDNGKDFKSKLFNGETITVRGEHPLDDKNTIELEGVFGRLGTTVHFVTPYRGQAKPIERFFRFVAETFSKEFPSYTGSNTSDRPDEVALYYSRIKGQEKRGDLLELEDVAALVSLWCGRYGAEHQHRGHGMHGRTPDQVFTEESSGPRPIMPAEFRHLIFAEQFPRLVRRTGIQIDGRNYYGDQVVRYLGQPVIARRPFREPNTIIVFDVKGRQLFTAWDNYLGDSGDAKDNMRRLGRIKKAQKTLLDGFLENPVHRKSLVDELPEARKAAGAENTPIIGRTIKKKPPNSSGFFKGV